MVGGGGGGDGGSGVGGGGGGCTAVHLTPPTPPHHTPPHPTPPLPICCVQGSGSSQQMVLAGLHAGDPELELQLALDESRAEKDAAAQEDFRVEELLREQLAGCSCSCVLDITTPGDGHCLFHALRGGGLTDMAIGDMRMLSISLASVEQLQVAAAGTLGGISVEAYVNDLAASGLPEHYNCVLESVFGRSIHVCLLAWLKCVWWCCCCGWCSSSCGC